MDLTFKILLLDVDLSFDLKLISRTVAVSSGIESGGRERTHIESQDDQEKNMMRFDLTTVSS